MPLSAKLPVSERRKKMVSVPGKQVQPKVTHGIQYYIPIWYPNLAISSVWYPFKSQEYTRLKGLYSVLV